MLGIDIKPVWRRKKTADGVEETVTTLTENLEVVESTIERLAVKAIVATIVVTASTVLITTAGKMIESAFDAHLNK